MTDALLLTALGMGVVFFVLFLISYMIQGISVFSVNKKQSVPVNPAPVLVTEPAAATQNSEEVVAAIMAAVTMYMGNANFKISSITPLVVRPLVTSSGDSAWSMAGIADNNRR